MRSGYKYNVDKMNVSMRRTSSTSHRSHTAGGAARVESPLTAYSHWLQGKYSSSKVPQVTIVPYEASSQEIIVERERPAMLQLSTPTGNPSDE